MGILLSLVEDGAAVGVDENVFALGLERLVEVGLAVELGVAGHCGGGCGGGLRRVGVR